MNNMANHNGGIICTAIGFTVHLLQRVVFTAHVYGKIVLVLELSGTHIARITWFLTALELNMASERVAQSVGFGATKNRIELTSISDVSGDVYRGQMNIGVFSWLSILGLLVRRFFSFMFSLPGCRYK